MKNPEAHLQHGKYTDLYRSSCLSTSSSSSNQSPLFYIFQLPSHFSVFNTVRHGRFAAFTSDYQSTTVDVVFPKPVTSFSTALSSVCTAIWQLSTMHDQLRELHQSDLSIVHFIPIYGIQRSTSMSSTCISKPQYYSKVVILRESFTFVSIVRFRSPLHFTALLSYFCGTIC